MYSLPNGIWKSKDFSQPVQFSILKKDTLAVFSTYKPIFPMTFSTFLHGHPNITLNSFPVLLYFQHCCFHFSSCCYHASIYQARNFWFIECLPFLRSVSCTHSFTAQVFLSIFFWVIHHVSSRDTQFQKGRNSWLFWGA